MPPFYLDHLFKVMFRGGGGTRVSEKEWAWGGKVCVSLFSAHGCASKEGTCPEFPQDRKRRGHLNRKKLCSESEGMPENQGELDNEEHLSAAKPEGARTREDKEKLGNEGKRRTRERQNRRKESQRARELGGPKGSQGESERARELGRASQGKPKEGEPAIEPRAAGKHPTEDDVPRKAKRKRNKRLAQYLREYKEAIHDMHLSREELREFEGLLRVEQGSSNYGPRATCGPPKTFKSLQDPFHPRELRGGCKAPQRSFEDIPLV
ncbi:PREDICTED: LOW QUALITY PROTEIN: transcription elongation factor A protein-like 4 [Myotis brandtii]|uniref:LOW QUALITY PROTEIN: transcription elongation factor A protein-like 4 n=1 Tax=Myotis brandtii TaxID=109478 RepID=UPI00070446F9|nr:PREDICTED: LOW QUALITY PROTEIN: transcription elongation factor A protein-like 4 [Myotis brandtii]